MSALSESAKADMRTLMISCACDAARRCGGGVEDHVIHEMVDCVIESLPDSYVDAVIFSGPGLRGLVALQAGAIGVFAVATKEVLRANA